MAANGILGDVLIGVENVVGTALNDILIGDGLDNRLEGGAGGDTLNGLGGTVTVTYANSSTAITVDLAAAPAYVIPLTVTSC